MVFAGAEFTTSDGQLFTIRSPSENEVEAIRELMISIADSSPYILSTSESFRKKTIESQIKWITESAANEKAVILALYKGDKMMGLSDASAYSDPKRQHRAPLGISLHADVRGQGIGTQFMRVLLGVMKTFPGVKIIELDVMTDNKAAIKLYENLGFKKGGRFPNAYILPSGEVSDNLKMYLEV